MGRNWSATLQEIHKAYIRRDTLDLYLNDGNVRRLSRGSVTRGGHQYLNYIRSVGDMAASIEKSVDRINIRCQNVNSVLGFDLASSLRLLDYAVADYGKIYQSSRNPALIEDIQVFCGVLANAEVDEEYFNIELIVDYESLGAILASRGLSTRCVAHYKNGIECTTTSLLPDCPKDRDACKLRGKEWEHLGWGFFEEPVPVPPGTGGPRIGGTTCFTGETQIWTPLRGDVPFAEIFDDFFKGKRDIYSFDELTGEIFEDEIIEVKKHEVIGHFTFSFDDALINVTPEHRFWLGFGKFQRADAFSRNETLKRFDKRWTKMPIVKIRWNSDVKTDVYNLHVRHHQTYFANRFGVHNYKDPNDI
jgi:hypothetical protein